MVETQDNLEETKNLQKILGILNYVKPFIKNMSQLTLPLYNKLKMLGQKHFNMEDKK